MEDEELIGGIDIGNNNGYWTATSYPDDRVLVYNSNTTAGDYTISKAPEAPIVKWEPKEDITPYEMALCAPLIICTGILTIDSLGEMLKDMDPKALRHFRIEDPNFKGVEWDVIK